MFFVVLIVFVFVVSIVFVKSCLQIQKTKNPGPMATPSVFKIINNSLFLPFLGFGISLLPDVSGRAFWLTGQAEKHLRRSQSSGCATIERTLGRINKRERTTDATRAFGAFGASGAAREPSRQVPSGGCNRGITGIANYNTPFFVSTSNGLQPNGDGLQPIEAMASPYVDDQLTGKGQSKEWRTSAELACYGTECQAVVIHQSYSWKVCRLRRK